MVQLELPQVNLERRLTSPDRIVQLSRSIKDNDDNIYHFVLRLIDPIYRREFSPELSDHEILEYIESFIETSAVFRVCNAVVLIKKYLQLKRFFDDTQSADINVENYLLNIFRRYARSFCTELFPVEHFVSEGEYVYERRKWTIDSSTSLDFHISRTNSLVDKDGLVRPAQFTNVTVCGNQNDTRLEFIDPKFLVFENPSHNYTDGEKLIYLTNPFYSPVSLLIYLHELFHNYCGATNRKAADTARNAIEFGVRYRKLRQDGMELLVDEIMPWEAALRYLYRFLKALGVDLNKYPQLKNGLIMYAESSISSYHHNLETLLNTEL